MVLRPLLRWFFAAALTPLVAFATIDPSNLSLQMQLGNPSNATVDPTNHNHYLIQRAQYALDYSDANGEPNWVSWDLTTGDVGGSGRSNDFEPDTSLPPSFYEVTTNDYNGVGAINFNRGHMCPSEDRTDNLPDNTAVFLMDNIIPQSADNNQGPWEVFESYCRSLAAEGNELLITSGPSLFTTTDIPSGKAVIPAYCWKIVVVVPLGSGTALSRITPSTRVIAVKMPNVNGIKSNPWQQYITSVNQIQQDTGFTFFSAVPPATATVLRAEVDGGSANGSPSITTQPTPQSSTLGGTASFTVAATGTAGTLTYQWYKDDAAIAGATGTTLSLSGLQASDMGNYYVIVSNDAGSVVSATAALAISGIAPSITSNPSPVTVSAGSKITLTATAFGSPTLTYQWQKDGGNLSDNANISGSATPTLTIANAQSGDIGNYSLSVFNSVNSAVSTPAAVSVTPAAPSITSQPTQQATTVGGSATFTVGATGSSPLAYLWRYNGAPLSDGAGITGSATATLTLSGVGTVAGNYDCVVSNNLNSATSQPAALVVNPAPVLNTLVWNFGVGTPLATPSSGLPGDGSITGGSVSSNNNLGTVSAPINTSSASSGTQDPGASGGENDGAAARSSTATGGEPLTLGANGSAYFEWTLTPGSGHQLQISSLSFGARSTSTGPQAYVVYSSVDNFASPIASGTFPNTSVWVKYTPTLSTLTGAVNAPVTLRMYGYAGTGSASSGTINWRIDDLTMVVASPVPPSVVSTSPAAGATGVAQNSAITLTFNEPVDVSGNWYSVTSVNHGAVPVTLSGGPAIYTLTPISPLATSDAITVRLTGAAIVDQASGSASLGANYTFSFSTVGLVPPAVTADPQPVTVMAGGNASFTVGASGTAPLTYHWRLNGAALSDGGTVSGSSTATLSITGAQGADAGNYDCVISNAAGNATSQTALLTVNLPLSAPQISAQPAPATVFAGSPATFTVAASGNPTPAYQWYLNSNPLSDSATVTGSATASLTISPTALTDSGDVFYCLVSNSQGSVPSGTATLTVNPVLAAPTITLQPVSQVAVAGSSVTLTAGATGNPAPTYQWRKVTTNLVDGGNLSGSLTPALTLNPVQVSDAGAYNLVAANGVSPNATTTSATLTVFPQGTLYWDFSAATPIGLPADHSITGGTLTQNNNNGTTALLTAVSVSSGYAGASGSNNAGAAARTGALNAAAGGSAYFEVSLTPAAGQVTVSGMSFGARSTSTGPQAYAIYTNADNFANPVATGTFPANSTWNFYSPSFTVAGPAGASLTLRLYGYNGTGNASASSANWRIDDLRLSATAALAPASVALSNLTQIYDGSAKPATVTTVPAGLAVNVTYAGNANAPSAVGTYAVAAAVTDPNYTGSASGTLAILTPPPAAVSGITLAVAPGQATVTWSADSGATTYNVKRAANPAGPFTTIAPNVSGLSFTDTGLAAGVPYFYTVTGVNTTGESPAGTGVLGTLQTASPANTDTLVAPVFGRPAAWAGTVAAASVNQIAVNGTPSWTANQFVATGGRTDVYFARILTGALAGQYFTVLANDTGSVTVDNAGANLTALQPGDSLELAPYWSLGTLFPDAQSNVSFVPSTSTLVRQTEILTYDPAGTGINRAPAKAYYYYNGAWRLEGGAATTSYSATVLLPDSYFLFRSKAKATTLLQAGRVLGGAVATYIEGLAGSQDNYVGLPYPLGLTLRQSGLGGSAVFATSASASAPSDELLVFNPAQTGTNKSPSAAYFYFAGGWRQVGAPATTDFSDSVTLPPGQGFILRKAPGSSSSVWTFLTGW